MVVRWSGWPRSITHAWASSPGACLAEASVRPVLVVVSHELREEPAELVLVPVQGAVEEFVADGA